VVELSTRPKESIGTDSEWEEATKALKNTLDKRKIAYEINEGEGAFYGPKIDIKLKDALSRQWQCATIQCDFALPERFNLKYTDKDGKEKKPIMLHRVILGSIERFIGALIEHYEGDFPLWLAPEQVCIIPITEKQNAYAENLKEKMREKEIRVSVDTRDEKMQRKIRQQELNKIPYLVVVGQREAETGKLSIRQRKKGMIGEMSPEDFIKKVVEEIKNK
ncbi:MAG: threonine--tRNA ligase, partial [Candidatus Omnitrophota bacterium]